MIISVNNGKKKSAASRQECIHDCQVKPDSQKRILPGKNPVLWQISKISVRGRNRPNKRSLGVLILVLIKVVTYLGHYNVNSYVNSPKTVSPLSATLTLVQK